MEGKPDAGRPAFVSPQEKLVTNRTYEEYLEQFQLPEDELRGKCILDVGAGFSNFSKEGNERLKDSETMIVALDPTYELLSESKSVGEYINKLGPANLSIKNTSGNSETWQDRFETIKNTPYKVAGSHQHLPFAEGTFNLALAHNSILQFKDREITRRALHEIIEVLAEDGEIRIIPSDLRWDMGAHSFYMATFEAPTPATLEEARTLNLQIAPDRVIFDIFKELEGQGCSIYTKMSPPKVTSAGIARLKRFMGRDSGRLYSFIIRKDGTVPVVSDPTSSFYKLNFSKSPDGFHVPSEEVLSEEEKITWKQKRAEMQQVKEQEEQRKRKIALSEDNARMPDELTFGALNELNELENSFTERMRALSRTRNERTREKGSLQGLTAEEQKEWSTRSATLSDVRNLFEEASRLAGTGTTTRSTMSFGEVRHIENTEVLTQIASLYREVRKKLESVQE
jgi:ubiquinone/menaquinone biosynthesis C-methylase UbiE